MSYSKTQKMDSGMSLYYSPEYIIKIIYYDEQGIHAEITNIKKEETHYVSCVCGYWRCTCHDWTYQWQKLEGAYNCKHIEYAHVEITYRKLLGFDLNG
jgi:hypothetical protein